MGMTIDKTISELEILKKNTFSYMTANQAFTTAIDTMRKYRKLERVLDKIRADIISYEGDCRLSVDEYPSCKQCTDNVFETIYGILDKHKGESEGEE